jgi:hypothetical protein
MLPMLIPLGQFLCCCFMRARTHRIVTAHVTVMRRQATREIVQVNFKTSPAAARTLAVGNHWPSHNAAVRARGIPRHCRKDA